MSRRDCMRAALLAGEASKAHILRSAVAEHRDFYRTTQRHDRWWLVTPEGEIFFSSGLNHIVEIEGILKRLRRRYNCPMQPQHAFMTVTFASRVTATFVPPVSAQTIDTSETRVQTARNPGFPRLGTTAPRNVAEIARQSWSLGCETLDRGSANYDSHRDCPVPLGIRNIWLQGRE